MKDLADSSTIWKQLSRNILAVYPLILARTLRDRYLLRLEHRWLTKDHAIVEVEESQMTDPLHQRI